MYYNVVIPSEAVQSGFSKIRIGQIQVILGMCTYMILGLQITIGKGLNFLLVV